MCFFYIFSHRDVTGMFNYDQRPWINKRLIYTPDMDKQLSGQMMIEDVTRTDDVVRTSERYVRCLL